MLTLDSSLKEICDFVWDKDNPEYVKMKHDWFNSPHTLLNNQCPVDLIGSPKGSRRVKQILLASIYGVYL